MKLSEIEAMTVDEILDKFDFPEKFLEDFKSWCLSRNGGLGKVTSVPLYVEASASVSLFSGQIITYPGKK